MSDLRSDGLYVGELFRRSVERAADGVSDACEFNAELRKLGVPLSRLFVEERGEDLQGGETRGFIVLGVAKSAGIVQVAARRQMSVVLRREGCRWREERRARVRRSCRRASNEVGSVQGRGGRRCPAR